MLAFNYVKLKNKNVSVECNAIRSTQLALAKSQIKENTFERKFNINGTRQTNTQHTTVMVFGSGSNSNSSERVSASLSV